IADVLCRTLESFQGRSGVDGFSSLDARRTIISLVSSTTSEMECRFYGEMLRIAVSDRQGRDVVECICTALLQAGHPTLAYDVLLECLTFAASWANRGIDLETAFAVVAAPHLADRRQLLVQNFLEPVLYASEERGAPEQLNRLSSLAGETDCMKYVLHRVGGPFTGRLQLEVDRTLGRGVRRVLVVQNIRDGQGDEIIRCVPLIQALLDFNPNLTIVLLTNRGYLYAHPRIEVVSLNDSLLVAEELETKFDGVLDFFEPNIRVMNHDNGLESKVQSYVQKQRPAVFLTSEKAYNHFVYKRVEVEGRCYARSLGLDRQRVENVYETTLRLLAEMGLPLRIGQNTPASEWVLAGCDWPVGATEWLRLTQANVDERPVALLGPFGGAEPLKGFADLDHESLAAQISGLIAEGFFVVLAPNGTEWGSAAVAKNVIGRLSLEERGFVAIGPDSAEKGPTAEWTSPKSPLSYRDTVTRMLTYFVRFASLVVAVEGWMIHAAYCLGKPYRTVMMPYSQGIDWQPFAQTSRQQIQWPMQPLKVAPAGPLVVEQPRKFCLVALLRLCGASADPRAGDLLYRAIRSPDRDLRAAAVAGLSLRHDEAAHNLIVAALQDPWYRARAAAAESLLLGDTDIARETLLVHAYIGRPKRDWPAIIGLGKSAMPALEVALHDDDDVVRRETAWAIRLLNAGSKFRTPSFRRRTIRVFSRLIHAPPAT
ncbi:MAG: HEAT repeat domain-containing protein, partial [Bryobacteraceae bacterium]